MAGKPDVTELERLRLEIDEIDRRIIGLFERRMDASMGIALYKRENGLPILDGKRELEVIDRELSWVGNPEYKAHYLEVLRSMMDASKRLQAEFLHGGEARPTGEQARLEEKWEG